MKYTWVAVFVLATLVAVFAGCSKPETPQQVATSLPAENATAGERRTIFTYLVQQNDQWLVDYQRTGEALMSPPALDGLASQINRLGDRLGEAFGRSSDDFSRQIDQMAKDFEHYSAEAERQAKDSMKGFGEALDGLMKELEQSIDEALEKTPEGPKTERTGLQQAKQLTTPFSLSSEPSKAAALPRAPPPGRAVS